MEFKRHDFPKDFVFGTASSSYQIEGHQFGGAGRTHWDDFAETPQNVHKGETGALACDHYHRFQEDLDLTADAGLDAYRFSTSWARVLPEGRGAPNPEGLAYYDRLVDAMLERGLKPALTLYHWELPSPLADLGGWRNRDIASWFVDYATAILGTIGDRLWSVAPINEPWCVAWLSHFMGHHAPGLRDIRAAARAMHHVLLTHGKTIEAMRAMGQTNLGGVFNLEWATPADQSAEAVAATDLYDAIYNHAYLRPVFKKEYPALLLPAIEAHLPPNWQDDFSAIGAPLDWCGINYYTRKLIAPNDGPWPSHHEVEGPLPKTQMGWEVYPEGLYKFLHRVAKEYSGDLPLYVTENGMASDDRIVDNKVDDQERIEFLDAHLGVIKKAEREGVPVKGYFIWSLLDNYEWALGYEKRFGLVHVDRINLDRIPKSSWYALCDALKE